MISLRNFVSEDAELLKAYKYKSMSIEDIENLINRWNTGNFHGHYFVMLAVLEDGRLAGMVSLYHYTEHIVSMRPEIFAEFRGKGIATFAMRHLMGMASDLGYQIVSQQVRVDNVAAVALHKTLGFEKDGYLYMDRNGSKVMIYLKSIL